MTTAAERVEVRRIRPADVPAVARLHYDFFGVGEMHGHSLANLGPEFLRDVFYGLNLDNPYLVVDVAEYRREIIAFSVYTTDWGRVSRFMLRHHPVGVAGGIARSLFRRGLPVVRHLAGNLTYLTQKVPAEVAIIPACLLLLGIKDPYRTREFRERTGTWVIGDMWDRMEQTMTHAGCKEFWSAPGVHNEPINNLFKKKGTQWVAKAPVQGVVCNFYVKALTPR